MTLASGATHPDEFPPLALADMGDRGREEFWATLTLRHCEKMGPRTRAKLLKRFGSAKNACAAIDQWRELGVAGERAESYRRETWRKGAEREWKSAIKSSALILLWQSAEYPACLRELADPPDLLYCKGDISLLAGPCVGVVGTRDPDREGLNMARRLSRDLSESGITVVSGMALGIDQEAHQAALDGAGRTIGALGTGIEIEYPRGSNQLFCQMRERGLLVSEFAPHDPPVPHNFPIRNRIISGLSLGVVVAQAAVRSGSLITARLALDQNREVFAVPGSPLNPRSLGCHNLIRQGARPVFSAEDIIADLSGSIPPRTIARNTQQGNLLRPLIAPECADPVEPEIGQGERAVADGLLAGADTERVLAALASGEPKHIDELLGATGLASGQLSAALLGLEMLGQIRLLAGSRYEAVF